MVLATELAILLPKPREMSINHDPPGSYSGNPPGLGLSVPPKDPDARSSVVADVPSSFPMQSPVQYMQDAVNTNNYQEVASSPQAPLSAHFLGNMSAAQAAGPPAAARYTPSEVVNPLPRIDTLVQGPVTDDQLALFHTAVHYSPTPEDPDGRPRSPTPFLGERETTPTPRGVPLTPLTLAINTEFAFFAAPPHNPDDPGPTPVEPQQQEWETATDSVSNTPLLPPPALPDVDRTDTVMMDDFLEHIRYPAMPTNILKAEEIAELDDVDNTAMAKSITDLKLAINDMTQGYANYYLGPELRLREDNTFLFGNSDLNTAMKVIMVALDMGLTSHTYNSPALGLTNTSWF